MLPVLRALEQSAPQHRRDLASKMADHFSLTDEERRAMLPSGKATVILSRTGWALSYLKQAHLLRTPRRGMYELTDRGRELLSTRPERVDVALLMRYPEFRDFRERSRSRSGGAEAESEVPTDTMVEHAEPTLPPDEALEGAYQRLRNEVEAEVLDAVKDSSPEFFENLVIDVLVRMGYGGSREDAARAVGRSGDGGIDGVIDEDRLGLDVIYIQAKRWEATVGRPEVQKFVGALEGRRARKGIMLTTSSFSREAEEYVQNIASRIVLIDGRRLAGFMFDFDVGLVPRATLTMKEVDGDYFEEE
jgi:restriction system protein